MIMSKPTLAQILAAKKNQGGGNTPPAPVAEEQKESGSGIRITKESEKEALAKEIKANLDALAPKMPPKPSASQILEGRELGAIEPGERIPMEFPQEEQDKAWIAATHAFTSNLGIMVEPGGKHAWLAVMAQGQSFPILIMQLPVLKVEIPF